jgi:RimJ/RimL family protein N-acetyltransferase
VDLLQRTGATTPWTGYLAVELTQRIVIGTCAFTAPPNPEGVVEIAYFTFPPFEGRGYASAMAAGLMELVRGAVGIRKVRAHTLPEINASTRILEKLGFERVAETVDPDAGRVWRWERDPVEDTLQAGASS